MLLTKFGCLALTVTVACECVARPKPHGIVFGKRVAAKWPNATGEKMFDLKARPLFVDTRLKEYTTGNPHELTDRRFLCDGRFGWTTLRCQRALRRRSSSEAVGSK